MHPCPQAEIPRSDRQHELAEAGLGERMVTLKGNDSPEEVKEKILQRFPKLKGAGGFEYMRGENNKMRLVLLPLPPGGFTGKYLKDAIRQGRIYLRPIQSDLCIEKTEGSTSVT